MKYSRKRAGNGNIGRPMLTISSKSISSNTLPHMSAAAASLQTITYNRDCV